MDKMRRAYEEYVSTVSTPDMAVSFQLAEFICGMAEETTGRILDLGSGFSSYALRTIAADRVWTVDDDPDWLDKTRRFIETRDVPTDRMFTWGDFDLSGEWGLILHDLGRMPVRTEALPVILKAAGTAPVVLDDLHKRPYRRVAKRTCRQMGFTLDILKDETLDEFGRYAGLAVRPPRLP